MEKEIVFNCRKCGHLLFVEQSKIKKIFKKDCPNCGEEAHTNWIVERFGNFAKEFPHLKSNRK